MTVCYCINNDVVICISLFTFSLHIDPLKYERDDLLGVDVSVPGDVLDGLQEETNTVWLPEPEERFTERFKCEFKNQNLAFLFLFLNEII